MKFFVTITVLGFIAAAIAAPFTEEQQKKGQEYVKKCIGETGATPEDVGKLKSGDFSNDDEKVQCFSLCFFREAGFMDASGNQKRDVIIEKLSVGKDKKAVEALYEKCKNSNTGATPCNKAFNAYKCYRDSGAF